MLPWLLGLILFLLQQIKVQPDAFVIANPTLARIIASVPKAIA
jgi:hypothetical protein